MLKRYASHAFVTLVLFLPEGGHLVVKVGK